MSGNLFFVPRFGEVVKQFDLLVDYKDTFDFVIDYVEKNAFFLNCIYDSVGRDELKRFFYQNFIGLVKKIVRDTETNLNAEITDSFRHFLCNFYTEAIAGTLIDLFQKPNAYDRAELFEYVAVVFRNSLPAILLSQSSSENEKGFDK